MNWIIDIPAFIFGLMVGSFLNVVIYRLPVGKSVVKPRSFCPGCGKTILWYENIPVLSWLFLRGKCRGCGVSISPRYPVIELLGGLLAVLAVHLYGDWLNAGFAYAFLMALLVITMIDWDHRVIPDQISLSFIVIGFTWSFINPDLSLISSAAGALAGGGSLWLVGVIYKKIRKTEGMGGGDVKLMAMIGAFLGIGLILPVIVIASLLGSIYGISLMRKGGDGQTSVAFGSFLAPAAAFCMVFGPALLAWYFGRF
ncbi:MAG: prepilin peptidase [Candidatus Krumholzibacteria bacterium]|nr:prepilin peptidase [Candidatus Krumholzibacteria bacterium]